MHAWLSAHGLTAGDPLAARLLAVELARQAGMVAFADAFRVITVSFLLVAPLVFILKKPAARIPPHVATQ